VACPAQELYSIQTFEMKYLLTGASGFLGRHILKSLAGKSVITVGRSKGNDIQFDISKPISPIPSVDVVIHCAGKAHVVPKTKVEVEEFYAVNYTGTYNLLEALVKSGNLPKQFVFISTVAVYGIDSGNGISESQELIGNSPYADSKIKAERLIIDWGNENGVRILVLRLPLIVGNNPPGNLGKMITGIQRGKYASIGDGEARKSMVLAEDVAQLIISSFNSSGIYNLTDGYHPSFRELENVICTQFQSKIRFRIPTKFAEKLSRIGDFIPFFPLNSSMINKMSQNLTFEDSKAREELGWSPKSVLSFIY